MDQSNKENCDLGSKRKAKKKLFSCHFSSTPNNKLETIQTQSNECISIIEDDIKMDISFEDESIGDSTPNCLDINVFDVSISALNMKPLFGKCLLLLI